MQSFTQAYACQKFAAKRRRIAFLLTFEEWLKIWKASKRLPQRGRRYGQYCMARYGDKGPYAVGNVRIILNEHNHEEQVKPTGWHHTEEAKRKMARCRIGKSLSAETRERMRVAQTGKKLSLETREKIARSHLGIRPSEYVRRKISAIKRGLIQPGQELLT